MIDIQPAKKSLELDLTVPGDKSISHRSLIFAAMADGTSHLSNLGTGADIWSTARVLQNLGVYIEAGEKVTVSSQGLESFSEPGLDLDVGNSGTTIRLLTGLVSGRPFSTTLTGDASIRRRPMGRIIRPLTEMGAIIGATEEETAPLVIEPSELAGIDYEMPVASAQVKSAIILAGLQAEGITSIQEQSLSRRHTEIMLQKLGAPVDIFGNTITVNRMEKPLEPFERSVPGDPSSAAYWAAAAAIIPGSVCRIRDVNLSPERIAFFTALSDMGTNVSVEITDSTIEPRGDIIIRYEELKGITIEKSTIPSLIDELPLIAVIGAFAEGTTTIRDAEELRVKESDRIDATVKNLTTMAVTGTKDLQGGAFDSFRDHRIAMAFAVAAIGAQSGSTVNHHEAASISYPEFWDICQSLSEEQ